eukprot:scaffold1154_cov310-Pinguiococcus_pyrenoidosus.AAC.29
MNLSAPSTWRCTGKASSMPRSSDAVSMPMPLMFFLSRSQRAASSEKPGKCLIPSEGPGGGGGEGKKHTGQRSQ